MEERPARLKKYELLGTLASGGMAEVHLARTTGPHGIEKLLVIKRLLPELAANKHFVRMFLEEARLAVTLDHPNIVQVYDVDEVDGSVFYAMEYLRGRDVRQIERRLHARGAKLPLQHALCIVSAVCAALDYAHHKRGTDGRPLGIVHRDVSPHNVFVRYDGTVKVIDFGIAKAHNGLDKTATGILKGKFGYMSPEQCLSQRLDKRSDVFCIGILLHELTTGRRLYGGTSEYVILKRIIETDPEAPSAHDPSYPEDLERIVMKALRRDRSARYPTADALQLDLDAFAQRAGVALSTRSLARFMEELFEDEVAKHREAERLGTPSLAAVDLARGADVEASDAPPEASAVSGASLPHDDTKSASVTETQLPPGHARAGLRRMGAFASLAALAVGGAIWLARSGGDAGPAEAPSTLPSAAAPASTPADDPAAASATGAANALPAANAEPAANMAAPTSMERDGSNPSTARVAPARSSPPRAAAPAQKKPAAPPPKPTRPDRNAPLPR